MLSLSIISIVIGQLSDTEAQASHYIKEAMEQMEDEDDDDAEM